MKIIVVDDHALFLEGMKHVLKQLHNDVHVLEANTCQTALALAGEQPDIGLVLLDLNMPGMNGFDALGVFTERHPFLPVVVLSASEDRADMQRALDSGALGFIPKSSTGPVMLSALRLVLSGGIYVPPAMVMTHSETAETGQPVSAEGQIHAGQGLLGITPRQLDVLALVLDGKANKVIASDLGLAEATVKAHVSAIFKALNVTNRTQAALAAEKIGYKDRAKAL